MNKDDQTVLWTWNRLMEKTMLLWAVIGDGKEMAFTPEGISFVMLIVGGLN